MEIAINNLTEIKIDSDFIKKIVETALSKEKKEGVVSLVFIGPGRMRKLNGKYRKKNKVTDVLSFPGFNKEKFPVCPEEGESLGEMAICLREIKKNAKRFNISFENELAKILIHGTLHLLGYDHEGSEKEAIKMRKKEEEYLKISNFS